MSRKKAEYRMGTGATSMLMIFIVLCLTTLSILSYSTAKSDLAMTKRSLMMVETYYEAANRAQQIIAEIDAQNVKIRKDTLEAALKEAEEAYAQFESVERSYIEEAALEISGRMYAQAAEQIKVEGVDTTFTEGKYLSFSVDAGHDRLVRVILELLPPGDPERYRIICHNLVFIDNWELESEFELFQAPDMAMDEGEDQSEQDDDAGIELILD